jgi:hypothetical protein
MVASDDRCDRTVSLDVAAFGRCRVFAELSLGISAPRGEAIKRIGIQEDEHEEAALRTVVSRRELSGGAWREW